MTKHVPGPWTADVDADDPHGPIVISYEGVAIAEVLNVDEFPCVDEEDEARVAAESLANAHLIAAAPELLESLRNLVALAERRGRLDEYEAALDVARGVIAKAEAAA